MTKTFPPASVISLMIFSWRAVGFSPGALVSIAMNLP
jgi:hypothetical protein